MAGAARVGALHVMLGLDSAQFTAGLAKANGGLAKFAKAAKVGFAVAGAAAVAAGAAMAIAMKGAIDRADDLSKTAQRIGVTTEALSRLEWAAKLSDVSLEQLSTGLQRLSRNMLDVASGGGAQAKTAFAALGISIKDAEGNMRSSDAVFADISERFANMPDGVEKTALAMQLFGRAGAEMIPLLNSGKKGLADMAAESDRLGNTLNTNTGKAAEQFNDSITRIQAVLSGLVNRITEAALPSLNQLMDKLADPSFAAAAQALAQGIVGAINLIVDAITAAGQKLREFGDLLDWMSSRNWSTGELDPEKVDARRRGAMAELAGQLKRGEAEAPSSAFLESIFGKPAGSGGSSSNDLWSLPPILDTTKINAASAALKQLAAEGKAVFEATRTPAEKYSLEIERLNNLLQKGAIDQDTYNRAVIQAQDAFQQAEASGKQWVSSLADSLSGLFGSILDGSKTAMEAVNDLIKSFAQMALQAGFRMLLGGVFGGGGGGGFLGIPGFANGTNYAPGGLAMVGERGPELVNLPRGSQVIPNSELMAGGVTRVLVELGPDLEGRILTQSAGQSVQIVRASEPSTVQKSVAASGKALAGGDYRRGMATYGLSQQAKRR